MSDDFDVSNPDPLSPIPDAVHQALPVVAAFGIISFITTVLLFFRLFWVFLKRREDGVNQFIALIFNLIFADIQQAAAFMLNAYWLQQNAIGTNTSVCWSQGFLVSIGDLSSGVFTFTIAVHAFMDIVFGYRLKTRTFYLTLAALWTFVYMCSFIGIAMHPSDFYSRAGAWCFINAKYSYERLYLHYIWIIFAEFGTIIIYIAIYLILNRRLRTMYYSDLRTADRAKSVAKMVVAYPIVYCICTLPLVTARLTSMAGGQVSYTYLCIAGIMVTCNGWLDVLLYTLTRSSYIVHGEAPSPDAPIIETFRMVGQPSDMMSVKTLDSNQALWTYESDPYMTRPTSHSTLWSNMDLKWENMRIQERASMSLRAIDMQSPPADIYAQPSEVPRFFQRIYQADNISLTPPRSPLSPISPMVQRDSYFAVNVAPVEKE